jgi:hypothetical protein
MATVPDCKSEDAGSNPAHPSNDDNAPPIPNFINIAWRMGPPKKVTLTTVINGEPLCWIEYEAGAQLDGLIEHLQNARDALK